MAAPRLMPNCFRIARCTSATVTLSITCSSPSTVSRLMTSLVWLPHAAACCWVLASYCSLEGAPWLATDTLVELAPPEVLLPSPTPPLAATNWQAISAARLESSGVRTEPDKTAALPAISARMLDPGTKRFSMSSRLLRSAPTAISSVRICCPLVSKKKALVWPRPLAIRKTRFDACTTASTLSGAETSTSLSSNGNCTSTDLPRPIEIRLARGKLPRAGICSTDDCSETSSDCPCEIAAGGEAEMPMTASSSPPAILLNFIRMVCQPSCRP